jgi:hypothetical protein
MRLATQPTNKTTMANNPNLYADLEQSILITLCILSYFVAMAIQIRDPKNTVSTIDWVLSFISSCIGATVAYFFALEYLNVGTRMFITILASLISYRFMELVASKEVQGKIAGSFINAIIDFFSRIKNKQDNHGTDR